MSGDTQPTIDRAQLQRRTVHTLWFALIPGQAAVAGSIAVVSLLVAELLGSDRWAGIGGAAFTAGAAIAAVPLAATMRRRGRRIGLISVFGLAAAGAVVVVAGGQAGSLPLLLIGLVLFGAGQAGVLQGRYVATDLAEPHRAARALAAIVWVGTLGAVVGPVVTPATSAFARRVGLLPYVGAYLFGAVLFASAAILIAIRLRPDPLVVAGGVDPTAERVRPLQQLRQSIGDIARVPRARLGLASMAAAQAAMVAVMTMTPNHMNDHGHADLSALVIAVHIFGMFGLAPLVGRFVDRVGAIRATWYGATVLGIGAVVSVVAGYVPALMFLGLFFVGLGWNAALISGSTLLTTSVPISARVPAQGTGDLAMSASGAVAALASGLVKASVGFHLLAHGATALMAVIVLFAWVLQRHEELLAGRTPRPAS